MFNDDVPAKCPECASTDVMYDKKTIACRACNFEESFEISVAADDEAAAASVNRAHALAVFQRWGFAG